MNRRSAAPPRKTIATRVLASFAVTVIAFAMTVGWSVVAQRRAAQDNEELARGYLPAALGLGQLRASQGTLAALVEGSPDERNPEAMRYVLETLARVRHQTFVDTRESLRQGLATVGSPSSRELAAALTLELTAIEDELEGDKEHFEALLTALGEGDKNAVNRILVEAGPLEHRAARRLRDVAERIRTSMDRISEDAQRREQRAIYALIALAVLTLGVGVLVSIHTRRLLAPLARVTERAQAVAHGDLTPQTVVPTNDEIGDLAMAFERMVGAVASAQAQALSNERLAAIGKMAAHVTHEIRNPLSSIGLNIELLEEELGAGESRSLLQAIAREVQRLEHLSEEYLRLARLPSPRMEAEDIAGAVHEVVNFSRAEMDRADCKVRVDIADKLPPALFDESQIRQALLNLLRNAREAMPRGGDIDVIVRAEGMSVVVRVNDRGGGIPDEIRPRVFDPFFSTKGEGTGLGLAITRQIVVAHGGSVTAEPREGGGTSFRVALPIAPARASEPRGGRPALPPARQAISK
ncbi:ATP-binding protein [Pendulispora albinea]|uniref:Signal transduction histidine-protein kinase/phosphatase MprB n=1 Tax=Pendulispora albinea TaxID=2741071 RepID=A0ABZ2LXK4_9BACT